MVKREIIYKDLSYRIIGILYDVFNHIGAGHRENYYQKALAVAFKRAGIKYKEQVYIPITYKGDKIGKSSFNKNS